MPEPVASDPKQVRGDRRCGRPGGEPGAFPRTDSKAARQKTCNPTIPGRLLGAYGGSKAVTAEIVTMLGVGVALGLLMWRVTDKLDRKIDTLSLQIGDLRERMAKVEGSVDLLTRFFIDRERGNQAAE